MGGWVGRGHTPPPPRRLRLTPKLLSETPPRLWFTAMDSSRMGREVEKRQRQSADDTPSGGTIKDGGPPEAFTAPFQEEENDKPTVGQLPQAAPAGDAEEGTATKATKANKAKRPGNSTPILHSDVEKLRRERLNYFVDELRNLVPVSSTGAFQA